MLRKKKRKLTAPFSFNTTSSIKDWWIAFHVAFVKSNLFCNLSSMKNNFNKMAMATFSWKEKKKEAKVKVTLSTQNSVRQFVGQLQQSKNRHLLIRRNLKFDFNIRTSTCYITTLTLLHSTPFISFPFVNITKLTDQKKHYSFL